LSTITLDFTLRMETLKKDDIIDGSGMMFSSHDYNYALLVVAAVLCNKAVFICHVELRFDVIFLKPSHCHCAW